MPTVSIRAVLGVFLLALVLSCSRPPDLVGIDNPLMPAASVSAADRQRIFIATTRQASGAAGVFFSDQRAEDLGLASVVVSIPPNHAPGEIERPRHLPPHPDTEFAIVEPVVFGNDRAFVAAIDRELMQRPPKDRHVLLFVHGYNNTITDSILRIGQFVEDTGFTGVPVLFSWASAGKATRYVYDVNSTLVARPKLLEAGEILGRTKATGVSIFAHSMGSLLTMEAIVQAQIAGRYDRRGRIDNVMLAAPDIDIDLFETQIAMLPENSRDLFVFVSRDDAALRLSRRLSGGVARVGAANVELLEGLGVTVLDLSQVEDSHSGSHSKFAGSPEVVQLIGASLRKDNYQRGDRAPTLVEILDGVPVVRGLAQ